ncbi:MAG: hypothetical protein J0I41_04395 [Filimonas sp.]|nr:hypothetical protein [Filimonas sp.]
MKYVMLIAILLIVSFAADDKATLKQANWLVGTWENKTSRGSLFESWTIESDSAYRGKSYFLKNNDTVVLENIRLVHNGQGIFYIPAVKNQNGGQPIPFALKTMTATEMIFENPAHDFPQVISYKRITNDSLFAKISGTKNGVYREQAFPMKRYK